MKTTPRRLGTLVAIATLAIVIVACNGEPGGLQLRVLNKTSQALTLSYDEIGHERELGRIEPGALFIETSVFQQARRVLPWTIRRAGGERRGDRSSGGGLSRRGMVGSRARAELSELDADQP